MGLQLAIDSQVQWGIVNEVTTGLYWSFTIGLRKMEAAQCGSLGLSGWHFLVCRGSPCLSKEYPVKLTFSPEALGQDPKQSMLPLASRGCYEDWCLPRRGQVAQAWVPVLSGHFMVAFRKVCWIQFLWLSPGEALYETTRSRCIYMQSFIIIPLPTPDCRVVRYLGEHFQSEERNYCLVWDLSLHFPFMWFLLESS